MNKIRRVFSTRTHQTSSTSFASHIFAVFFLLQDLSFSFFLQMAISPSHIFSPSKAAQLAVRFSSALHLDPP